MNNEWTLFFILAGIIVVLLVLARFIVAPWLSCYMGWCEGYVDCDEDGAHWKCSKCGKTVD